MAVKDWIVAVPDYASLAYNYGTSEMTIYGAEGGSPEEAVIIRGANTHEAGVLAEHYWIKRRYPGYERLSQEIYWYPKPDAEKKKLVLINEEAGVEMEIAAAPPVAPRIYDVLYIKNWYGRTREIHFDITPFINKGFEPRSNYEHTGPSLEDFIEAVEEGLKNNDKN